MGTKQKIILVGGCFDILHIGHIRFLKKAKSLGDILIVLLESDQKIRLIKGKNRPVNSQKIRAEVLSALKYVDDVILLPADMKNNEYDLIVKKIKPDFIAVTKGDPKIEFKKRTAKLVNAKVKCVISLIMGFSTRKIIDAL